MLIVFQKPQVLNYIIPLIQQFAHSYIFIINGITFFIW